MVYNNNTWRAEIRAYHQRLAEEAAAFSALSRHEREAAFHAVRAKNGSNIVTIMEMLEAHRQLAGSMEN
ncbi:MAG: hypothetical protein A4E48_00239 [Methanosaeta sp. PtaU1.Bin060]|nr:MAG: hypothetical protein A4E48_00239 [Methanosaeta sp. PtaU1.Bin060]